VALTCGVGQSSACRDNPAPHGLVIPLCDDPGPLAAPREGDGDPVRHRLDLLGNRQVNRILYTMSVTKARHLPLAREYMARKRAEGKSKKEARRAHKRQLAKRVIRRMWADQRRLRTLDQTLQPTSSCRVA
jgi:transposase